MTGHHRCTATECVHRRPLTVPCARCVRLLAAYRCYDRALVTT